MRGYLPVRQAGYFQRRAFQRRAFQKRGHQTDVFQTCASQTGVCQTPDCQRRVFQTDVCQILACQTKAAPHRCGCARKRFSCRKAGRRCCRGVGGRVFRRHPPGVCQTNARCRAVCPKAVRHSRRLACGKAVRWRGVFQRGGRRRGVYQRGGHCHCLICGPGVRRWLMPGVWPGRLPGCCGCGGRCRYCPLWGRIWRMRNFRVFFSCFCLQHHCCKIKR